MFGGGDPDEDMMYYECAIDLLRVQGIDMRFSGSMDGWILGCGRVKEDT
jgi:hypothetical protein